MKKHLHSLIFFLFAVLLTGAAVITIALMPRSQKNIEPSVVATIFPIYDIAKNVAGDTVKVSLILPAGADAHSFEPSPSLIREITGAKAVYVIGGPIDAWSSVLASDIGAETVSVNSGIILRAANDEEDGSFDPHYWLSVKNAKIIAFNIASDLIKRFPEKAETITANTTAYILQLDTLEIETQEMLKDIPNKNIVTFHDAWYYFADEYGLNVAGTFEPTAGREPTPQYLAELVQKISAANVKTIYYEPQMSITGYQTFANDYNIELKALDDIGGVAPYDSYINLIKTNVSTLQNNQ